MHSYLMRRRRLGNSQNNQTRILPNDVILPQRSELQLSARPVTKLEQTKASVPVTPEPDDNVLPDDKLLPQRGVLPNKQVLPDVKILPQSSALPESARTKKKRKAYKRMTKDQKPGVVQQQGAGGGGVPPAPVAGPDGPKEEQKQGGDE